MTSLVAWMLLFWLALSVLNQIAPTAVRPVLRFDTFALVPNWRFFSPVPKKADTLVAARVWTEPDCEPSNWTIVSPQLSFAPVCAVFHPRSRLQKATGDIASFLLIQVGALRGDRAGAEGLVGTLPYTILLSFALGAIRDTYPEPDAIVKVQFGIVDAFGDLHKPRVMFMSEVHDA